VDNVDTTTLYTPQVLERVKLWREHYSRHNFLKKLWRGFLVTTQLFFNQMNWKKTGTYGPP